MPRTPVTGVTFLQQLSLRSMAHSRGNWLGEADPNDLRRLLCARRKRPCGGCAAEQRDDGAPPHSITSSAMERTSGEMVRPSALAVLALITSSNSVACHIGRSAGLAPLRMRPT